MPAMTVNCPNCTTEIRIASTDSEKVAVCPQCRNGYQIIYDDLKEEYRLEPPEPLERPEEIDTDKV